MVLFGWFMPGPLELFIIGLIVLLLFGNRLPSVMRSLGKGITEFKKGVQGIEDDLDQSAEQVESSNNDGKKEESIGK